MHIWGWDADDDKADLSLFSQGTGFSIGIFLLSLKKQFKEAHLNELFKADVARFKHFSVECDQIVFDFSKHRIDQNVLNSLIELAQAQDLNQWIKRLFSSEQINCTEQRAAMHWALRLPKSSSVVSSAFQDVHLQLERMNALVEKIHAGQYRESHR